MTLVALSFNSFFNLMRHCEQRSHLNGLVVSILTSITKLWRPCFHTRLWHLIRVQWNEKPFFLFCFFVSCLQVCSKLRNVDAVVQNLLATQKQFQISLILSIVLELVTLYVLIAGKHSQQNHVIYPFSLLRPVGTDV